MLGGTVSHAHFLLGCHLNGTEYLISQEKRIVSPDDSPDADGIQPDDRDSLKFLLPKEPMDVRHKPLAADRLYAYEPVCSRWN